MTFKISTSFADRNVVSLRGGAAFNPANHNGMQTENVPTQQNIESDSVSLSSDKRMKYVPYDVSSEKYTKADPEIPPAYYKKRFTQMTSREKFGNVLARFLFSKPLTVLIPEHIGNHELLSKDRKFQLTAIANGRKYKSMQEVRRISKRNAESDLEQEKTTNV